MIIRISSIICALKNTIHNYPSCFPDRYAIFLLIITNFICNNIFLFSFQYYSDDWPTLVYPGTHSIFEELLKSQRPISNAIFVILQNFADNVLFYHIMAFISSTILLILVYLIFKKIFSDLNYANLFWPFIGAIIFCVLFNKDQIYPWAILSLEIGYILPLLAIYFYLFKERKHFLLLSLIVYFISLLTYEVGITVPLFLIGIDYLRGEKWKHSLYFIIPLIIYLTIRVTEWFGFGTPCFDRGMGYYDFGLIIALLKSPFMMILVFGKNLLSSIFAYTQMGLSLIAVLISIDLILLYFLYQFISKWHIEYCFNTKLLSAALIMIITFIGPYIISGGISGATREYYLIDVGIALLIICVIMLISQHVNAKVIILCIIGLGIIVNQGLFYNWVVSGNIQNDIDIYMRGNSDEISKYNYFYFNTTSYEENIPNSLDQSLVYLNLKNFYRELFGSSSSDIPTNISQFDYGYNSYLNAKCIDRWVLNSMLRDNTNSDYILIYGNYYGIVPVQVTINEITYKDLGEGIIYTVPRDIVFELNYTSIHDYGGHKNIL